MNVKLDNLKALGSVLLFATIGTSHFANAEMNGPFVNGQNLDNYELKFVGHIDGLSLRSSLSVSIGIFFQNHFFQVRSGTWQII